MGKGLRRRILEFAASLTLSIFVIALYDLYQDDRSRQQELALDQEGPEFLRAADAFLAQGPRGEEKLLSIVRSPTVASPLKFRAAVVLASGPGERGRTIREALARPWASILGAEEMKAVRGLFEEPLGLRLDEDPGPTVAPDRLLVDSIARRIMKEPGGLTVAVTAPAAGGGRRISLSPNGDSTMAGSPPQSGPALLLDPPTPAAGHGTIEP